MINNYKALAANIIRQAIVDITKTHNAKHKESAIKFIKSSWCKHLCEMLEIKYSTLKSRILK